MEAEGGEESARVRKKARSRWRKVLYGGVQGEHEDNHTVYMDDEDEDAGGDEEQYVFLKEKVENANFRERSLWIVVRDSVAVSQHACVVGLVGTVWTHALNGDLDAWTLLRLDALVLVLGFATLLLTHDSIVPASLGRHAFNFAMFVIGLYILAPIFQTLTRSFSSDSIWASTICLLLVHLLFHDYTYTTVETAPFEASDEVVTSLASPTTPRSPDRSESTLATRRLASPITFSANVSLNASIIASVLIASRLSHSLLVFAVMLFSLEFFLLFPRVAHQMRRRSVHLHLVFSCLLIALTLLLIYAVNFLVLAFFVIVLLFITVVSPYELIRIQKYKHEINGPWDEAKLSFIVGD
ncbi:phosphatidylinositol N-acetylglucosaminyltransferase subunit C [Marchantia polymorpha subsp. ruderalis]|uniref:Phosphatidylinositol N-acetylglucosaminyltransferase n=2 Tax=Marchantia polymorpha TaxID=3197 RepID=A0AAF6AN84_MARPO|nr:hypothetical protein MARPO_0096s0067 [Marchantia polymorpha]BBM97904.1 hypothetical protein Mp_1g09320 [Marchantia polymorpha subsp. ruderalis]|eukprot:PTQ32724.1 hypothetical protein MARPO_0096s0067 [Marchantia polymorpha]